MKMCCLKRALLTNMFNKSRDSEVGIATDYGLADQVVDVRVLVAARIFTSPCRPDRLWGPPYLQFNGYRGFFLEDKVTRA
jgi:hypothetical protein